MIIVAQLRQRTLPPKSIISPRKLFCVINLSNLFSLLQAGKKREKIICKELRGRTHGSPSECKYTKKSFIRRIHRLKNRIRIGLKIKIILFNRGLVRENAYLCRI